MEHYEFIDGNVDGDKERVLGATVQLYNKLSADETNLIRDKINELVDGFNLIAPPIFPIFALKFKGDGNTNQLLLEVGDIVHGFYDATTIWDNATYDGGDPTDKDNYTFISTAPNYEPMLFTATGSSNVFTLTSGMIAKNVFLDRGMRYKGTEWTQVGNDLTISGATLAAGRKIYVTN